MQHLPISDASTLAAQRIMGKAVSAALNTATYKLPEAGLIGRLITAWQSTPGIDFCARVIVNHASKATIDVGQPVFGWFSSDVAGS